MVCFDKAEESSSWFRIRSWNLSMLASVMSCVLKRGSVAEAKTRGSDGRILPSDGARSRVRFRGLGSELQVSMEAVMV